MEFRNKQWTFGQQTAIMGILNVTPDSFSDGGRYDDVDMAIASAKQMVLDGADIIDVGGESSRPNAQPVSADEECRRVIPVVQALSEQTETIISVDTCKAEVAMKALQAGAHLVNDITALYGDPKMGEVVVEANASTILMHMQGTPDTMQKSPSYQNVVSEVYDWLKEAVDHAVDKGVREDLIIVDPGIGFGKTFDHNLQLLRNLEVFRQLKCPLLVGTSRKAFIGQILNLPADQRDGGTAATVAWSISKGVDIVRVHDVATMKRVAKVTDTICRWQQAPL